MYNPAWTPEGVRLHDRNDGHFVFYWNDALWHKCVPKDARGLSYLDVGFHHGGFLLRFAQRGGAAVGVDVPEYWVNDSLEDCATVGAEASDEKALFLRNLWSPFGFDYAMRVGGFSSDGKLLPSDIGRFSVVSCLNVIEYMLRPEECVKSLFYAATDMVLIATDYSPETIASGPSPLRFRFSDRDLMKWCKWPSVAWTYSGGPGREPQVFVCSVNPESSIPFPDKDSPQFDIDLELTETEKHYRSKNT